MEMVFDVSINIRVYIKWNLNTFLSEGSGKSLEESLVTKLMDKIHIIKLLVFGYLAMKLSLLLMEINKIKLL